MLPRGCANGGDGSAPGRHCWTRPSGSGPSAAFTAPRWTTCPTRPAGLARLSTVAGLLAAACLAARALGLALPALAVAGAALFLAALALHRRAELSLPDLCRR